MARIPLIFTILILSLLSSCGNRPNHPDPVRKNPPRVPPLPVHAKPALTEPVVTAKPRPIKEIEVVPDACYEQMDSSYNPNAENALTYKKLKKLIIANHLNSVEEFLDFISQDEDYAKLLYNPVLNEVSMGLHSIDVDANYPRIVMHLGRLIVQTIGDGAKESSRTLEILEYDHEIKDFRFALINFGARPENRYIDDAAVQNFSDLNDEAFDGNRPCLTCHYNSTMVSTIDSKPRWTSPPIFKTSFGKFNDAILVGSEQMRRWGEFQKTLADPHKNRKYQRLTFNTKLDEQGNLQFINKPSLSMTQHLGRLNLAKTAERIKTMPRYRDLQYALAASFLGCGEVESYLPQPFKTGHDAMMLEHLQAMQGDSQWVSLDSFDLAKLDTLNISYKMGKGEVNVSQRAFFIGTVLPLKAAMKYWVEQKIQGEIQMTITMSNFLSPFVNDLPNFDAGFLEFDLSAEPVVRVKADYSRYYQTDIVTDVWYLLYPYLNQRPDSLGFALIGAYGSFQHEDFAGGITNLMKCEIGPDFKMSNPDIASYFDPNGFVQSDDIVGDKEELCGRLKDISQTRLAAWSNPRLEFVPNTPQVKLGNLEILNAKSDGELTLADSQAGLLWTPVNPGTRELMRWPEATAFCDNLIWAGRSDWRMPTLAEVDTLRSQDIASVAKTAFGYRFNHLFWSGLTEDEAFSTNLLQHGGLLNKIGESATFSSAMCVTSK